MSKVKPERPPRIKGPPLVCGDPLEDIQRDFESDFYGNKILICLAMFFGMGIGYFIGIGFGG